MKNEGLPFSVQTLRSEIRSGHRPVNDRGPARPDDGRCRYSPPGLAPVYPACHNHLPNFGPLPMVNGGRSASATGTVDDFRLKELVSMSNGVRILALIVGLALIGGAVFLFLQPRSGQETQAPIDPNDTVLATVNGEAIRTSEMERIITQLPENARAIPPETLRPLLLDQMINQKLVLQAATAQQVKETPEYKQRLAAATERAVQETYFEKIVKAEVTDEAVKKRYDEFVAANPPEMEVRARHILVPSQAEAKKVIDRLKKGEAFEALATELTQDPTGKTNGGDLGYFSKGMMVEPFANAAFAMQPGQTSPEPVQTQFGWHVIKVEDRRPGAPPPLEQLKPQLQNQMTQEVIQAHLAELKGKAKIDNTLAPVESANPPAASPAAPAAPATP